MQGVRIRKVLASVLLAVTATMVAGLRPAAADHSCWYCTVSIADATRSEYKSPMGTAQMGFTVRLGYVPNQTVKVGYTTAPKPVAFGVATENVDYIKKAGTVQIAAGSTTATVWVTIVNDTQQELNEIFEVKLVSIDHGKIADGTAVGTILDDDPPSLNVLDAEVGESGGSLGFTVRLSGPLTTTVTVNYATANVDAMAPSDYTSKSGTLVFSPGEMFKTVSVPVVNDQTFNEANERMKLVLSNAAGAPVADSTGYGKIFENDFIS